MSTRMYGLMVQLISSVKDKDQKAKCAAAIRLSNEAISSISDGSYEAAVKASKQALEFIKYVPNVPALRALCQAYLGMALFQLGQHADSQQFNLAAVPVLLSHPDFANEAATCLNIIGGSFLCQGRAAESIKPFEDAIRIWSRIPGSASKISDVIDNLELARRTMTRQDTTPPKKRGWRFW
jgi:tetratricopeptide (TPR) repeat protein